MSRLAVAWVLLAVSGLLEVAWAIGMKRSDGFRRLWPTSFTLVTMAIGIYLLALATRELPISTAYPVWVGIGAIGTAAIGMLVLGEPAGALRIGSIALIVGGVIGLKLAG